MIGVHANTETPRSRPRPARAVALLVTLLLLVGSVSGCVRVRAAMAVTEEDQVSGEFVVAMATASDNDPGPKFQIPPELKGRLRAETYREEQFAGTRLMFQELSFDELRQVLTNPAVAGPANNRFAFSLRRSGPLVIVDGTVDLKSMPKDRTDVRIKISFPGRVTTTNAAEEDGTLSWNPRPGEVTELRATVEYAGTSDSWTGWLALVIGLAIAAAGMVAALALITHRRARQTVDT